MPFWFTPTFSEPQLGNKRRLGVLILILITGEFLASLTLQRGVTGTARMLHALTHSSISRQVREQM